MSVRRFLACLVLLLPGSASALEPGAVQVRGLLDVTAAGGERAHSLNAMNNGDSSFDPYRLRLFVDADLEGGFEAHVQAMFIGQDYRVFQYGAYALWTPLDGRDLHLEAGYIPWPIGTWGPRTYSNVNVLVGAPMLYQLHGTLSFAEAAPDVDALLAAAGSGEFGVDYGSGPNARGVPILYDRCWDVGAVALGSARPVEFSLGFVQGAPSWPQIGRDASPGKTLLGRLGFVPSPALRLGVSGARGPWMPRSFEASLPAGTELEDLEQLLAIADFELQGGRVETRGEAYVNEWETPHVGRLVVRGAWAETKLTIAPGAWLAARGEARRHSKVSSSAGERLPWDHDRDRWEAGVGYRATRQATVKAVWQRNVERFPGADARNDDLYAATLSLKF